MTDLEHSEDYSAAVPLEVPVETAERAEALLRDFADDAELNMALIVDQCGMLIAGITAEADVSTDVISALAAGANGAVRALAGEIGDESNIESIHQGENSCLYFRGLSDRFVLVGTADSNIPAGIIREKAAQIQEELTDILQDVREAPKPSRPRRKLHSMQRAAVAVPQHDEEEEYEPEPIVLESESVEEEIPVAIPPIPEDTDHETVEYAQEEEFDFPAVEEKVEAVSLPPLEEDGWNQEETSPFEASNDEDDEEESLPPLGEEEEEFEVSWGSDEEAVVEEEEPQPVEAIQEPEEKPSRPSSPPVLVSPVVVDSPFEAIDDEDEDVPGVEIESETKTEATDEEESEAQSPPPPLPNVKSPSAASKGEETKDAENPSGEKRNPGPRYSFELG